jgi:hypothetical protein
MCSLFLFHFYSFFLVVLQQYPAIFSHLGHMETTNLNNATKRIRNDSTIKSTSSDDDDKQQNFTLDLIVHTLNGYEIRCVKVAVKRFGELYNIE